MVVFTLPDDEMIPECFRVFLRGCRAILPFLVLLSACGKDQPAKNGGQAFPAEFGLGAEPTVQRIAAMDIDVNPSGTGLPAGEGTHARGATIYAQKCAACHGPMGEGAGPIPRLIGVDHQQAFDFASDPKIPKTIGNYWPYATTLYDYIHRAMPYSAPGSLQPDEVYSLVAFLLAENGVIPRTSVLNAEALPRVVMPARNRFRTDDRKGGSEFR